MKHLITLTLLLVWSSSFATKPKPPVAQADAKAISGSLSASESASKAVSTSAGGEASLTNEVAVAGSTQGIDSSYNVEASAPDVIFVPNNNTEDCLRVWGLFLSNQQGGGGFGVPSRSAACDFEQAADDAAATGDHRQAWFWRCHKKNIYKQFDAPKILFWTMRNQGAIDRCHAKMVTFVDTSELQRTNTELRERVDFLLKERTHEREVCDERVERCESALVGGK